MTGSDADATRERPAAATTRESAEPVEQETTAGRASYGKLAFWFWPAILVACAWWIGLVTTAVRTANPVTLNYQQVRQSILVVEGEVVELDSGRVRVERSWPIGWTSDVPAEITVRDLEKSGAERDGKYLLPLVLSSSRGGFVVTRANLGIERKPDGTGVTRLGEPQIYPVSDEAIVQLERILASVRPRPE